MPVPTLHTERSILRQLTDTDAPTIYKQINDRVVLRNMEGMRMFAKSLTATLGFIRSFDKLTQRGYGYLWGIEQNGKISGVIGIMDLSTYPLIFYTVATVLRNQGIATAAIAAVCAFAQSIGVETLSAEVNIDNIYSVKALEKNQFSLTATSDAQYTLTKKLNSTI